MTRTRTYNLYGHLFLWLSFKLYSCKQEKKIVLLLYIRSAKEIGIYNTMGIEKGLGLIREMLKKNHFNLLTYLK